MPTSSPQPEPAEGLDFRQRLDKWLFFARIAKSRSIAQGWIVSGHVTVNGGSVRQPAFSIKRGDRIEVTADRRHHILVAIQGGEHRGPYQEARLLYEDHTPERPKQGETLYERVTRDPGSGRPTKKERRDTDRLQDFDGE